MNKKAVFAMALALTLALGPQTAKAGWSEQYLGFRLAAGSGGAAETTTSDNDLPLVCDQHLRAIAVRSDVRPPDGTWTVDGSDANYQDLGTPQCNVAGYRWNNTQRLSDAQGFSISYGVPFGAVRVEIEIFGTSNNVDRTGPRQTIRGASDRTPVLLQDFSQDFTSFKAGHSMINIYRDFRGSERRGRASVIPYIGVGVGTALLDVSFESLWQINDRSDGERNPYLESAQNPPEAKGTKTSLKHGFSEQVAAVQFLAGLTVPLSKRTSLDFNFRWIEYDTVRISVPWDTLRDHASTTAPGSAGTEVLTQWEFRHMSAVNFNLGVKYYPSRKLGRTRAPKREPR